MMNEMLKWIKNIKGGPISTLLGLVLVGAGIYMYVQLDPSEAISLTEGGLITVGSALLLKSDDWIKGFIGKGGSDVDSE